MNIVLTEPDEYGIRRMKYAAIHEERSYYFWLGRDGAPREWPLMWVNADEWKTTRYVAG